MKIALAIVLICIILAIRNEIIYRIRGKLIDKIYSTRNWEKNRLLLLDNPSYNKMIFMMHKWTFKQFYKDRI